MKLTEDNQDEMDCRPLGRNTGTQTPPDVQARIEVLAAKRLETAAAPSARRSVARPRAAE